MLVKIFRLRRLFWCEGTVLYPFFGKKKTTFFSRLGKVKKKIACGAYLGRPCTIGFLTKNKKQKLFACGVTQGGKAL